MISFEKKKLSELSYKEMQETEGGGRIWKSVLKPIYRLFRAFC